MGQDMLGLLSTGFIIEERTAGVKRIVLRVGFMFLDLLDRDERRKTRVFLKLIYDVGKYV